LRGVHTSESLFWFFCLFVLIDPLLPVDLDVLGFYFFLGKSGPELCVLVFLDQDEEEVEAGFVPLGLLCVDFCEEVEAELILFGITASLKVNGVGFKLNFLFSDISELNFEEHSVLALGPFDKWMIHGLDRYYQYIKSTLSYPN
jgi:hypothetical protein